MQYKLSHLPLLKIVLPLIAGILFFNYTNISFPVLLITTGVLFMVFLVSHFSIETQFLKKLNAVIGIAFVFIIGGLMISNKKLNNQQNHSTLMGGVGWKRKFSRFLSFSHTPSKADINEFSLHGLL